MDYHDANFNNHDNYHNGNYNKSTMAKRKKRKVKFCSIGVHKINN